MENVYFERILPEANKMLKKAKLPENKAVLENQKNVFFNELKSKRFAVNEKDEVIVLDESGNLMDNAHGWPMSGKDAIEETFDKLFERNGMPETEEEYLKRLRNPKITAKERIELTNYWLNKDK
ncbi:MAG TPA: hypothetical protein VIK14_16715 [Ignavibacteria bacterium]